MDTTSRERAVEANETGFYRLRGEEAYQPLHVPWWRLGSPRLVVEHALAKVDPALIVEGGAVDLVVEDAVGSEEDLIRGVVKRVHGPFPVYYNLTKQQFVKSTGREPVVGEKVNTTALLVAKVHEVSGDAVRMRVNVNHSQAIFSRTLASLFRIEMGEDGQTFKLVLAPLRDSLFTVTEHNPQLGLRPATYLWGNVTDEHVEYVGHPDTNPALAGQDYRLQATFKRVDTKPTHTGG